MSRDERRRRTKRIVIRRWKLAKQLKLIFPNHDEPKPFFIYTNWHPKEDFASYKARCLKVQKGKWRSRNPIDCGHTRCVACHYYKVFNIKHFKEIISDLKFKEGMEEIMYNDV